MTSGLVLALDVLLVLTVAVVLGFLVFGVRRRVLQRHGGTFDCSLRLQPHPHGKGWMLGVARYTGDCIEWYRLFSYSPRPRRRFARQDLTVLRRRPPVGSEAFALLPGAVVVECEERHRPVELSMTDAALTGFLSWLEAAPPGQNVSVA